MRMSNLGTIARSSSAVLILTGLLGVAGLAAAQNKKTTTAPAKPAPAAKTAPAGNAGAQHGTAAGGSATHGPTANGTGSKGPTANGTGSHGPTANGTGSKGPSAGGGGTNGKTTPGAPGAESVKRPGPRIASPAPKGSSEHTTAGGSVVRTRSNGKVSDVHNAKTGADVHHGLTGGRRVSTERPDHSRTVSESGRRGYVQHPYSFHGHDFARRSYYYHGRAYDRFYHGYYYRGIYVNVYAPGFYYGPGFYGWAYNPWGMPIAYGWGWGGAPWYGYYGNYFAPYPMYPSASFWLTDYMISSDLQASYAARQEGGEVAGDPPPAGGPPALTPDVKQMISDEVRAQLALENQEAAQNAQQQDVDPNSSGVARLLSDGRPHVFVAGGSLDLVDASSGQECAISDGDALQLATPPAGDATAANLVVLSSKGGQECAKSATVTVQLSDLQEMQNHMRETIDQGLQELQAKQGKGGLPVEPPSAQTPTAPALYAAAAPPPDANVAAEIQQQNQQGDQAEKEVSTDSPQAAGGVPIAAATAPASVELGQTPDAVKAALGQPARVANLGPKVIYYYSGMKVTFKDGKVSDVQ